MRSFSARRCALWIISESTILLPYIDASGQMVIKPQFDGGGEFIEGLAHVSIGGTCDRPAFDRKDGYIDCTGRYVWKPSR
ncbi:MAG TPA: WG repeat-containing protein [Pyrinomonadaceae bacterium]